MDTAKVVGGEVQAERGPVVLPLLREAVRQASQSTHLHPHSEILAPHNRSANTFRIRPTDDWDNLLPEPEHFGP